MKKVYIIFLLLATFSANSQNKQSSFKAGEWLRFRIHYGIFNASYATLQIKNDNVNGTPVYHVIGKGRTTGLARVFFKVDDTYESYFDKNNGKPYKFIRKVSEGSYTLNLDIDFDHKNKKAVLNDHKKNKKLDFKIQDNIQDLISAFYYVRNNYDVDKLVKNETITLNLLYDDDGIFKFKLKYLGKETLKTKYGKVECHKFRPYVESGRVFKEQESLSLWVSNDENKIPIRIKADLAVGSIKADLDGYAGLKHQFKIIMD